jgi:hypothetical protein
VANLLNENKTKLDEDAIRDLNAAARAAIRNGHLQASMSEYTFHRLKRSGNPNPVTPPQPTPADESTTTP